MSKRVKGTKVDLATFNGQPDSYSPASYESAASNNRGRDVEREGTWKNSRGSDDARGGFRAQEEEESWRRVGPTSSARSRSSYDEPVSERPEHMRLKLTPKNGEALGEASNTNTSDAVDDKWSKAFKTTQDSRRMDTGKFNERGSGRTRAPYQDKWSGGDGRNRGYGNSSEGRGRYDSRREGGSQYGRRDREDIDMPLPTAPRAALSTEPVKTINLPTVSPPVEIGKSVDQKALKAAKQRERDEQAKRLKEAKEAAAKAAAEAIKTKKEASDLSRSVAADAVKTGIKGNSLTTHIQALEVKPTGSALLYAIIDSIENFENSNWFTKDEYGDALSALLISSGDLLEQKTALYCVQELCHNRQFPSLTVEQKSRKLIEYIFSMLNVNQLIDPEVFLQWADDEEDNEVPGRLDAIVQTNNLILAIRLAIAETDEDQGEEEEEEIDAPREFL